MNRLRIRIWVLLAAFAVWTLPALLNAQNAFVQGEPRLAIWLVEGSPADRVIVVVHGGPGVTHHYLRPELDVLSEWGELVYYDQRGCGESDRATSYTWEDHVDDLHRLIQTVSDQKEVVLVASSWGVTLTVGYLEKYPDDDVVGVILSGIGGAQQRSRGPFQSKYPFMPIREDLLRPRSFVDSVRAMLKDPSDLSTRSPLKAPQQSRLPPEIEGRLEACETVNRQTISSLSSAGSAFNPLSLDIPSVVFIDEDDDGDGVVEPWDDAARRRVIKVSGHDPWFTHSELYRSVVAEFFRWLDQGTGSTAHN